MVAANKMFPAAQRAPTAGGGTSNALYAVALCINVFPDNWAGTVTVNLTGQSLVR